MKKIVILFSVLFAVGNTDLAQAGMSADMKLISQQQEKTTHASGHYYYDFDQMRTRMDMKLEKTNTSIIIEPKAHTSIVLMHDQKTYMKTDADKTKADYPWLRSSGSKQDLRKIFEKEGWSVSPGPKESIEGHSCEVWTLTSTTKPNTTIKTWLASDFQYHPLKSIHTYPQKRIEMSFYNIKTEKLKNDLFSIPSGYQPMTNPLDNQALVSPKAKAQLADGSNAADLQEKLLAIMNDPKLTAQQKQAAVKKLMGQ